MTTDPRVEAAAHANYVRNMSPVSKRWDDLDGDYKGLLLKSAALDLAAADAAVPLAERPDYKAGNVAGFNAGHIDGHTTGYDEGYDEGSRAGQQYAFDGVPLHEQPAGKAVLAVIAERWNRKVARSTWAERHAIAASLGVTLGPDGKPTAEG